jgi:hypothetical protein
MKGPGLIIPSCGNLYDVIQNLESTSFLGKGNCYFLADCDTCGVPLPLLRKYKGTTHTFLRLECLDHTSGSKNLL